MTTSPAITVPRRAGVAALVLVALALAPNRAAAGCGDSLTVQYGEAADHPMESPVTDRHDPLSPCHGPECSGQPPVPFTPATPPVSQGPDAKAYTISPDDPSGSGSEGIEPTPAGHGPVDRPTPIYHPPRA